MKRPGGGRRRPEQSAATATPQGTGPWAARRACRPAHRGSVGAFGRSGQLPLAEPEPERSRLAILQELQHKQATTGRRRLMDPNKFTGERPGWGEGFEYDFGRHVAAYQHAAVLAAGKRVLGEGFGTHTLCEASAEVTGVDYSEVAISECRRLWAGPQRPNLRFERVDLTKPGLFAETFDVVLNFQVLEHIVHPLPFLRGLRDRLGADGVLMLTTPNRLRTISENPFHVREYTAAELEEMLSQVFGQVQIEGIQGDDKVEAFEAARARAVANILRFDPLGVRNRLPRLIVDFAFAKLARLVRRQAGPDGGADIHPEHFAVRADDIARALDLVAFCRR